ncbi:MULTISPECIES: phosphoethanolamine transferase EptA [Lelliottia]|uniref:Phosphoethanolamine transferase EptA n=1 Tax=Lelliottia wanjuensis TaxID=3050585 RepID=A0AAP4CZ43_9ENTR|nr:MULTISPECIES: phosphoethanolamine transferase EptA [unclassified Lelliottia]MDK9357456.1 phosphoethanolamine transferase EptA [Lelliottia sp. V106_16]MDK9362176.1 phosphoethanolamine transferase EptA [Lelliottia sp. V106_12]MDK9373052.1 phosphoethanolamine transferase EptA [Lelliottia sp. V106_10]MDK9586477.1 phosphoethanolamine transferase EptA [Lelliottia sp. V86_10]MDK9599856.1 phosphoethanolamine transferase EptA [Lelliottia sp. V106_5]
MWSVKKLQCNDIKFTLGCALFFTVLNALFIQRSWEIIAPAHLHDVLFAASVPLVLFCGWVIVFSLLNIPFIRKPLMILLTLGCAGATYFMYTYGAVIDQNMMVNVFETNSQEATALVTPQMLLWIAIIGLIPSIVLMFVRIRSGKWWYTLLMRVAAILGALMVIILVASVFYKDYASLFRNNKSIVKMVTPANYVSAIAKYSKNRWFAGDQTLVRIGQDAQKGPVILAQKKKTVLVLVVGEASRAENYSLNGYARDTNPQLKKQNMINFPQASSCGTETAVSLPCMFSNMPRKNYDADLARHQEGLLDVLAHAGVNLLWRENDGGCKGACDRIPHTDMTQWKLDEFCKDKSCIDDVNLHRLDNVLDGLKQDSVLVIHLMGSHGPAYYQRYPKEYRQFTPTCDTNQIQDCDHQALMNTYDNTILYTDSVVSKTIDALKARQTTMNTALIYLSDHGESLGENGLYLHGTPYLIAPTQQTHIPFMFWLSPDYVNSYSINEPCLRDQAAKTAVSQDNLFSTVLGMMNVKSAVYQPQMDIINTCRKS